MTRSAVHTGMQSERPTKWQIFSASSMLIMKENEAKVLFFTGTCIKTFENNQSWLRMTPLYIYSFSQWPILFSQPYFLKLIHKGKEMYETKFKSQVVIQYHECSWT